MDAGCRRLERRTPPGTGRGGERADRRRPRAARGSGAARLRPPVAQGGHAPPAGRDRRPEVARRRAAAPPADPGSADRVVRGEGRDGVLPRRPAEDQLHRGDRGHVERLRRALQDPAGRGEPGPEARGDRHRRALRPRVGGRAQAHPPRRDRARVREPARHPALHRRVLQPREIGQGREGHRRGALGPVELRAAGRAREDEPPARRERPAHRQHRRLAVAVRLRPARERHPHRAAPRHGQGALPDRRRAARRLPAAVAGHRRDDEPHQDPRPHGRGREAPPPGRPHQDAHRGRPGGRAPALDPAHRLRREARDADLRPGGPGQGLHRPRLLRRRTRRAGAR